MHNESADSVAKGKAAKLLFKPNSIGYGLEKILKLFVISCRSIGCSNNSENNMLHFVENYSNDKAYGSS